MFTEGKMTLLAGEALAARRRVKLSGATIIYADAGDEFIGVTEYAIANGESGAVRGKTDQGIFAVVAAGVIAAGAEFYGADDGKVSATVTGKAIGFAVEAATADGDKIPTILCDIDPVHTTSVTLTAAQVKALAATQIELIPAPGADKYIEVLSISMILDYGTTQFAEPSAPDDLEVVYNAAGGTSIADVLGDWVIQAADSVTQAVLKDLLQVAASTIVKKAVVLDNNGAEYTAGDSLITVKCTYIIHEAGLA